MGYDCYVEPRRTSPLDSMTRESTQAEWSTAMEADQEGLRAEREAGHYFRRALGGGSRLADALIATGMGFDAECWGGPGKFPAVEDYGCTRDGWDGRTVGPRAAEYEKAVAEHLSWHGPEIPGIPVHKVCSTNDGWHVTQAECRAALALYEQHTAGGGEHPEAFREDFLPFLREAARRDGFSVH